MLVSIIIPVYNAAPYIKRCLDSCLVQTHRGLEVICVDDGSTDGSGTMLDEYVARHTNVKVVHQQNGGVVAARKAAIDVATGEFCYFLDSDDWLPETALSDLLALVNNDIDIAFGNQAIVGNDGTKERRLLPQLELSGPEYMNESLRHTNGCIGGKMFRTEICRRLSIDTSMRLNEDLLMNIQAGAMARKARRLDKVNYFYNWAHEGSLSKSQSDASMRSVIAANRHVAELLRSRKDYGFILADGYIAYLQKNIASALGRPPLPEMQFLAKEVRTAVVSAPLRYFAFARRFGAMRVAIWLAPLGIAAARVCRAAVIFLANIRHRKTSEESAKSAVVP